MDTEIKGKIKEAVLKVLPSLFLKKEMIPDFSVEDTNEKFGDYSSNVSMVIYRYFVTRVDDHVDEIKWAGKDGGKGVWNNPEELAIDIVKNIEKKNFESIEVSKPGFINFKISLPYLYKKILEITKFGEKYGENNIGENKTVNIEFISANPTGPLTIGNARGGVIGDCLANIYSKCGWQVTREYYFNDSGGQIDILGHSILGDEKGQYQGDYIDDLRKRISTKDFIIAGQEAAKIMIDDIKKTVENMGIRFDSFFAEGEDLRQKDRVEEVIRWLESKNLTYEKEGAMWFRSTEFGDDKDRVLIKSSGEPTYFAVDCAYHRDKFLERKFDRAIDIWGADHHGDIARVQGFVKALGYEDKFQIILNQFVNLQSDGKDIRMSKRTGNFITVDDLLKDVGKDVYRYFMLNYDLQSHINFDLDLAKEQSQKNPVYYVQYAYARICSILAKYEALNSKSQTNSNDQKIKLLKEPSEIALIKELIKLPDLVKETYEDNQIQRLPQYAYKLATKFHNFYENCQVITDDEELTSARIELVKATQIVLKNVLNLMGISAPKKM